MPETRIWVNGRPEIRKRVDDRTETKIRVNGRLETRKRVDDRP
jgi:hypothetical protein